MTIPLDTPPMPWDGAPVPEYLNLRCVHCGYLLTGLKARVCPECGKAFDPLETWQANVRGTWEFHFTYKRPLWSYVAIGLAIFVPLVGFAVVGLVTNGAVYVDPAYYAVAFVAAVAVQILCVVEDWHGPWRWIASLHAVFVWTIVCAM
ncbi:MAG: hypothetical protein JXA69_09625 [Phycisphaerae bacterium]|nr:hypothetical protein [Phycisphaerae bacterium]